VRPPTAGEDRDDMSETRVEPPTAKNWMHGTQAAAVARMATAHNSGETVWEQRQEDETVVLRMSSWPRAREAEAAMLKEGWAVEYLPDDGKGHTLIRVAPAPAGDSGGEGRG
jgi:hypothetical protein